MTAFEDAVDLAYKQNPLNLVQVAFGKEGIEAAFEVMRVAHELFRHVEPERISTVLIYKTVKGQSPAKVAEPIANFATLANSGMQDLAIEVDSDGFPRIRDGSTLKSSKLAETCVVYSLGTEGERFHAGTHSGSVPRLDGSARSQFAIPTFRSLRDALTNYSSESVRESTCFILDDVWHDKNRLFLKAGPEETIRRSLTQFLRNRLGGDHDVWPEQNVDESHPVDIQVRRKLDNNRLMLIEIKWLGKSADDTGHVTVTYADARANEGAAQLAEYVDSKQQFAPDAVVQAFLVVFDGRRKGLKEGMTTIVAADGLHFENTDIVYEPAFHEVRDDFDPPIRMFARPRVLP